MYTCNMLKTTEKYTQFLTTAYIFDNLIWLFVISRQKTAVRAMKIHIYCNYFSWTLSIFKKWLTFFAVFCHLLRFLFVRPMHCEELLLQNYQFCKTDNVEQKTLFVHRIFLLKREMNQFLFFQLLFMLWRTDYGHMMTRSQILYSPKPYPNPK